MRKDIKELFRRHFFPNNPNDKSPGYNIIVLWHFHLQEAPLSLYKIMQLWLSYLLRSLKVEPRASYIFLRSVVQTLQKSRKYSAGTWRSLHTSLLKGTLKAYFNWLCISFYYISSGISALFLLETNAIFIFNLWVFWVSGAVHCRELDGLSKLIPMSTNCRSLAPESSCWLVCFFDRGSKIHRIVLYVCVWLHYLAFLLILPRNIPEL